VDLRSKIQSTIAKVLPQPTGGDDFRESRLRALFQEYANILAVVGVLVGDQLEGLVGHSCARGDVDVRPEGDAAPCATVEVRRASLANDDVRSLAEFHTEIDGISIE
jgi:hypothetical protein